MSHPSPARATLAHASPNRVPPEVAELTGRKFKLAYDSAGRPQFVKRAKELDTTLHNVNMQAAAGGRAVTTAAA